MKKKSYICRVNYFYEKVTTFLDNNIVLECE